MWATLSPCNPTEFQMSKQKQAEEIINNYMLWSAGGGMLPIPIADIAAVSALQVEMLSKLAALYDTDISQERSKAFIAAVAGTTVIRYALSALKVLPGLGTIAGSAAGAATSAASTFALGHVAVRYFEQDGSLDNVDVDAAREAFAEAFEEGKARAKEMQQGAGGDDAFTKLEKLGKLRDAGVITQEEFAAKKAELLAQV